MAQKPSDPRAQLSAQEKEELLRRRQVRLAAERGTGAPRPDRQPGTPRAANPPQRDSASRARPAPAPIHTAQPDTRGQAGAQTRRPPAQTDAPTRTPPQTGRSQENQRDEKQRRAQQQKPQQRSQPRQEQRPSQKPQQRPRQPQPVRGEPPTAPRPTGRTAARKARGRRTIITVCLLLAFIVLGAVLSVTVLFKIDSYSVDGESPYSESELIAAFGHEMGENMFRFSLSSAEESMHTALPYLETIKVRRRLPGTVVFIVSPATEYAVIDNGDGTQMLLSETMRVLDMAAAPRSDLLKIEGFAPLEPSLGNKITSADEAQDARLFAMTAALKESGIPNVTAVNLADPYELSAIYAGRITIRLGTESSLAYKFSVVKNTLEVGAEDGTFTENSAGTLDASTAGTVYYRP